MRLAGTCLAILLIAQNIQGQSTLSVHGCVTTARGAAVPRNTVVNIIDRGGNSGQTRELCSFDIPDLKEPIRVGFPVTFRVAGWVINDPYVGTRGRVYLPDPNAESINIYVLKSGDKALLSRPSIEKMLGQRAFFFDTSSPNAGALRGMESSGAASPVRLSQQGFDARLGSSQKSLAYRALEVVLPFSINVETDWKAFLAGQAQEIGFPPKVLEDAVQEWVRDPKTVYEVGLVALYNNDFEQAAARFEESLAKKKDDFQLTISAAYAEYKRGKYEESIKLLRPLAAAHPQDPLLRANLDAAQVGLNRETASYSQVPENRTFPHSASTSSHSRDDLTRQILQGLERADRAFVIQHFNNALSSSFSDEKMRNVMNQINPIGRCDGQILVSTRSVRARQEYVGTDRCQSGRLQARVLFDNDNSISGVLVQALASYSQNEIETKARGLVEQFAKNDFSGPAVNLSSDKMAQVLDTFRYNWGSMAQQFGPFTRIVGVQKDLDYDVVNARCVFGKSLVNVEVAFDTSLQISGLTIQAAPQRHLGVANDPWKPFPK
ncbi:MAG: tetratricopeptide repeat protein [Terriglobales bacterium]